MTKRFCDKCKEEIACHETRTLICPDSIFFRKDENGIGYLIDRIELCPKCKDELGETIKSWLDGTRV